MRHKRTVQSFGVLQTRREGIKPSFGQWWLVLLASLPSVVRVRKEVKGWDVALFHSWEGESSVPSGISRAGKMLVGRRGGGAGAGGVELQGKHGSLTAALLHSCHR